MTKILGAMGDERNIINFRKSKSRFKDVNSMVKMGHHMASVPLYFIFFLFDSNLLINSNSLEINFNKALWDCGSNQLLRGDD